MESENINFELKEPDLFNTVTPLSKYLAMVLFVALPFIGGLVGYLYAPERVIEVEKIVIQKPAPESNIEESKVLTEVQKPFSSTRVTIETDPIEKNSLQGDYSKEKRYLYENGLYRVSFTMSRYIEYRDDYSEPKRPDGTNSLEDGTNSFDVWFSRFNDKSATVERFLSLHVHNTSYCRLALCSKKATEVVQIYNEPWEYIDGYEYCDVGHCNGTKYVYRKIIGNYSVYLESDESLHSESTASDETLSMILSTLRVNEVVNP